MSFSVYNHMKNLFAFTLCFTCLLILIGCGGDDDKCSGPDIPRLENSQTLQNDLDAIAAYAMNNALLLEEHSSGLRYLIESEGSEDKPDLCDQVLVNYNGYFLNGEVFDAQELYLGLNRVITGWQVGIPLFGRGGKGKLFIPSYLAYGVNPTNGFAPNTPIAFDIEVLNF